MEAMLNLYVCQRWTRDNEFALDYLPTVEQVARSLAAEDAQHYLRSGLEHPVFHLNHRRFADAWNNALEMATGAGIVGIHIVLKILHHLAPVVLQQHNGFYSMIRKTFQLIRIFPTTSLPVTNLEY